MTSAAPDPNGSPESTSSRTLVLVRHAKAEQWSEGGDDHSRSLSGRGRRDASAAGRWFAESDLRLDAVVCSPSTRTRETWQAIAAELEDAPEATFDDRVYNADVDDLLAVLQEADPNVRALAVIGHAPGIPELAAELDASGHPDLEEHFATCAVAVLAINSDWADLDEGAARLTSLVTPRG